MPGVRVDVRLGTARRDTATGVLATRGRDPRRSDYVAWSYGSGTAFRTGQVERVSKNSNKS